MFEFNFNTGNKPKSSKIYQKKMKFTNKHYKQAEYIDGLLKTKLPLKDEEYFFITQNKFNQFAFTLAVLNKEPVQELYISSYNVKNDLLLVIEDLLTNGKIKYCKLVITYSIQARLPEVYKKCINLNKKLKNFDITLCDNHTKLSCIKTDENYYVVSGSGNFTSTNKKMEQYQFINSEELFNFYTSWFNDQKTEEKYLK